MGACETTPPAHAPGHPTTLRKHSAKDPSSPPMIHRRSSASSSFVLAAARLRALQLDPLPHGDVNQAAARKIPNNSQASPATPRKSPGQILMPS